jgi:outer membrane protein assembly factor BamA
VPPDYDGRPDEPDTGENVGTWTLRVVFFPAYVVSEYVIRRPLGWVTVEAERINLVGTLIDFFTFGPNREAMLFPTALIDFGFQPSVGLYFTWNDAFAKNNAISAQAATWGLDWLRLSVGDRYRFAPGAYLGARVEGWRRPDWLYYGTGPRSRDDDSGRYARRDLDGTLGLDVELPRTSYFTAFAGFRSRTFEDEGCCGRTLGSAVQRGFYPLPPGFEDGYSVFRQGFALALDTRQKRPGTGSGVRVAGRAEQNVRLRGEAPDQFVRYGGTVGGFLDVTGENRTIGLSLSAAFADPIGDSSVPIPFTDQVLLGGSAPMRGFLEGRLVDRSALVAKLEYTWPVWVLFDGALTAEAGNVYGEHLEEFDPELARLSFALGIRAHGRRDKPFEALLGLGTAPLDEGAGIDSIRFVFGATDAF